MTLKTLLYNFNNSGTWPSESEMIEVLRDENTLGITDEFQLEMYLIDLAEKNSFHPYHGNVTEFI